MKTHAFLTKEKSIPLVILARYAYRMKRGILIAVRHAINVKWGLLIYIKKYLCLESCAIPRLNKLINLNVSKYFCTTDALIALKWLTTNYIYIYISKEILKIYI